MFFVHRRSDVATEFEVEMLDMISPSLWSFTEQLCQEYLATNNDTSLDEYTTTLHRLEKNLRHAQTEHFRCGYHHDSYFLQVELDRVWTAGHILEEMLCHAMEGIDVAKLRSHNLLLYQSILDLSFDM